MCLVGKIEVPLPRKLTAWKVLGQSGNTFITPILLNQVSSTAPNVSSATPVPFLLTPAYYHGGFHIFPVYEDAREYLETLVKADSKTKIFSNYFDALVIVKVEAKLIRSAGWEGTDSLFGPSVNRNIPVCVAEIMSIVGIETGFHLKKGYTICA